MKRRLLLAGLLIVVWCAYSALLFVDQAEYVYVTQFGRPVATYDGRREAGPAFKLPWPLQTALRLDRRQQLFNVPTQEFFIRDRDETGTEKPLLLTFDLFVVWRIGGGTEAEDGAAVDRFVRAFGTTERAETFLRSLVISRLKIELGDAQLADLLNTDRAKLRLATILRNVREKRYRGEAGDAEELSLARRAERVGIAVEDVGLRRFNHPIQVRKEIFDKIIEDRKREANNYRLQGEEKAARIRAEGDLEARRIRAEAEADRIRIDGAAEAESARVLNEAHRQAPELYRMVRLLKAYRQMFGDDKTQLILSLDHPLLTLFKEMPKLLPTPPPAPKE